MLSCVQRCQTTNRELEGADAALLVDRVAGLLRALRKPDRVVFRLVMASGLILAAQLVLTAFVA